MEPDVNSTSSAEQEEIARLVEAAREYGELDQYDGKRHSMRVADGLQLEVTLDPRRASGGWPVTMHDVSHTGVAFWSKHDVARGATIFLREFSANNSRPWIQARVRHRTTGLRGVLVGASFSAAPQEAPPEPVAAGKPTTQKNQFPKPIPRAMPPQFLPPGVPGFRR